MLQEEIIQGNKLIGEFIGGKIKCPDEEYEEEWIRFSAFNTCLLSDLKYHFSWDQLMPIVEKIEAIRDKNYGWFQIYIHGNVCNIESEYLQKSIQGDKEAKAYISDPNAIFETKIESTWYNVVKFIEFYNQNIN